MFLSLLVNVSFKKLAIASDLFRDQLDGRLYYFEIIESNIFDRKN